MFDLLGFWFNVSVVVSLMLVPILVGVYFIAPFSVKRVTGDEELAEKASCWFGCRLYEDGSIYPTSYDHIKIFNRVVVHDVWYVLTAVAGIGVWLAYSLSYISCENHEVHSSGVEGVAAVCTTLAPYTGWVAIALVGYFSLEYVARKFWKIKLTVDKLSKKGEE